MPLSNRPQGRKLPMFDATLLRGKRILIAGGGTGLGKEMAVGFAGHGAHVYICGRRKEVLDLAAREIRQRSGGRADALIANVRDPDSIEAMMTAIWADGPLDGDGRLLLHLARLRQAVDRRRSARRDHQQSRYLGLDRIGLCGAIGDVEGGG